MIAVIDDGVNPGIWPQIGSLCFDMEVTGRGKVRPRGIPCRTESHGTNCAGIIKKYAPDAPVGSICIFGREKGRSTPGKLAAALRWCLGQDIEVINISIGFTPVSIPAELAEAVSALKRKGTAVFAANSNKGVYTLPACMEGVFGVRTDPKLSGGEIYRVPAPPFGVGIAASSRHILDKGAGISAMTGYGNSYGCALAAACCWNHLKAGGTTDSFLGTLAYREEEEAGTAGMPEDVPVVAVEGQCGEWTAVLRQVCAELGKKGYRAAFFSRGMGKPEEGPVFRIPWGMETERYLETAAEKLSLSVVLTDEPVESSGKLIIGRKRGASGEGKTIYLEGGGKHEVKAAVRRMIRTY